MMLEYPSIDTIWKRDMAHKGRIIEGDFSCPEFAYLARCGWQGTEKVDGTNIRVYWGDDRRSPEYGGRTASAQIPASLIQRLRDLFDDVDVDQALPKAAGSPLTLYGEGYGAKIQKGGGNYKRDGVDFVLFDVRVGNWWLERSTVEEIAADLGLQVVPVVFEGNLYDACERVREGMSSRWGPFPAEGLVLKPDVTLCNRKGERIVTKIKTKDYAQS